MAAKRAVNEEGQVKLDGPLRSELTVQQALRRHAAAYLARYAPQTSPRQRLALTHLLECRTAELGRHAWHCTACDHLHLLPNSCRDRACITCGGADRGRWLTQLLEWKLPTRYDHLVFTLPHELLPLIAANPAPLYRALFHAASAALLKLAHQRLGAQVGAVMVLHSWGQRMNHHAHVHTLVTAGGLLPDGSAWVGVPRGERFLSRHALAGEFRAQYLKRLAALRRQGKLRFPHPLEPLGRDADWEEFCDVLEQKRWIVNVQPPPPHCKSADAAIKYLANYVTGAVISDARIAALDDHTVTINLKDYRRGCRDQLILPGEEFVRRFLQHVLPKRFVRVRYYGFLSHTQRTTALQRCQELLGAQPAANSPSSEPVAGEPSEAPERSLACPHCGRPMQWLGELPRPGGHYRYAVIKLALLSESLQRQLAAALPPPDS